MHQVKAFGHNWYAFYLGHQKFALDLPRVRKDAILYSLYPESNCFHIHLQMGMKSTPHRGICFLFGKQIHRGHSNQVCAPSFQLDCSVNKTIPLNYSKHQHELPSLIGFCVNLFSLFAFIGSDIVFLHQIKSGPHGTLLHRK